MKMQRRDSVRNRARTMLKTVGAICLTTGLTFSMMVPSAGAVSVEEIWKSVTSQTGKPGTFVSVNNGTVSTGTSSTNGSPTTALTPKAGSAPSTSTNGSSTWETPSTTPTKPAAPKAETPGPRHASLADAIIATGEKYLGTPYKFGANYARDRAFDCSEFTRVVFGKNGITLPRSSRQQAQVGRTVALNALQKGDLIFFDTSSARAGIDHVAIYAGNGKILHAIPRGGVQYSSFSGYWVRTAVTAKRVIQ
jgi:Cell wall-associated hydrolases (invasion-associated proteins)